MTARLKADPQDTKKKDLKEKSTLDNNSQGV